MDLERIIAGSVLLAGAVAALAALRIDSALAVPAPLPLALTAIPLPLDPDDRARQRIGALHFLGAVELRSTNPRFGGVSALRAGPGQRLLGVTDTGNWLAFDTVERGGRLTGVANAVLVPILDADGSTAATKSAGDAEALDWDPAAGTATVVYEQDHRLAHFTGITGEAAGLARRPDRIERLTAMAGWPANGGGEAVALLPGASRIVISETARGPQRSRTALLTVAGTTREIYFAGIDGHAPTDAVALDDHRILVLNRAFTMFEGQSVAISLVDLAPALDGATTVLPARELARWAAPLTLDNMEGLALRRERGRVLLYLVSDNNLSGLQRTILMKFELAPDVIADRATSTRIAARAPPAIAR